MSLFGRKKKNTAVDSSADPERYRSVHVMRDDLDGADGKKKDSPKPVSPSVSNAGLASDSPFLASSASASPESGKETHESPAVSSLKDLFVREKSPIVFDDDASEEADSKTAKGTDGKTAKEDADRRTEVHEISGRGAGSMPGVFPARGTTGGWEKSADRPIPSPSASPESKPVDLPVWEAPMKREGAGVEAKASSSVVERVPVRASTAPKSGEKSVSPDSDGNEPRKSESAKKKKDEKEKREIPKEKESTGGPKSFPAVLVATVTGILLIVGGGLYAYVSDWGGLFGGKTEVVEVVEAPVPIEVPEEPSAPSEDPVLSEPFSRENPNFLVIDTESDMASAEGVTMMFKSVESDVASMNVTAPVEFVIRDPNNNPIAFSRFAYMLGLTFPSDMLAAFDENFSLYVVPDDDRLHRGIAISLGDREAMLSLLASDEDALLSALGDLLYGGAISGSKVADFRDGSYGTLSTRFVNLDPDGSRSFDYVLLDDMMVIGTSKDSFRAVLGKMLRSM